MRWQAASVTLSIINEKWQKRSKKDRWLFLGCIIIASVFWTMQKLSSNYSFSQIYTVRYSMPDGKVFKKPPVSTIEVTLVGLGWDIVTKSTKKYWR